MSKKLSAQAIADTVTSNAQFSVEVLESCLAFSRSTEDGKHYVEISTEFDYQEVAAVVDTDELSYTNLEWSDVHGCRIIAINLEVWLGSHPKTAEVTHPLLNNADQLQSMLMEQLS